VSGVDFLPHDGFFGKAYRWSVKMLGLGVSCTVLHWGGFWFVTFS
jgi:hypothetical protein